MGTQIFIEELMAMRTTRCFLISILSLAALTSASSICPDGWWKAGDICYIVSQSRMPWYSAQEYCWENGGYLAEIKSYNQEDSLDEFLNDGVYYWLGLTDLAHEGTFKWEEGHDEADYTNWWPGEPDGNYGEGDCVFKSLQSSVNASETIGWDDYKCDMDRVQEFS